MKKLSSLEKTFAQLLKDLPAELPRAVREYVFTPDRNWAFDFAWPQCAVAVELEGGIWIGGSHTRGGRYASDCEKYNEATLRGWRVLRFTTEQLKQPQRCLEALVRLLDGKYLAGDEPFFAGRLDDPGKIFGFYRYEDARRWARESEHWIIWRGSDGTYLAGAIRDTEQVQRAQRGDWSFWRRAEMGQDFPF